MSDDFCSAICSMCWIICAGCLVDFSTYRHRCVEMCGMKRFFGSSRCTGGPDSDDVESDDEEAATGGSGGSYDNTLPAERQPLLRNSTQPSAITGPTLQPSANSG